MLRQPNNIIYKTVVILWLTLSVGSVVLAVVCWAQLSARMTAGADMTAIREELDGIFKSLLDVETGARGYVITGDKKFLEPLDSSTTNLTVRFNHLVELAHEDSAFLKGVTSLRAQAEMALNFQHDVIAARDRSFSKAGDLIAAGDGKKMMDEVRDQVMQLGRIRSARFSGIRTEIQTNLSRANLTSLAAGIVGLVAGIFAFWLLLLTLKHQQRERELIEARLQAEHSNQEKTVFLANMSHEIRTPMNAILGFSELLQNDLHEPKHRQYLKSIRTSADSLLQLINDILDMSKIEAGMMELRPEPTDPREICDFIRTLFSEPAAKKSIRLECQVAADLPHTLLMDRIRLRQVLVNLVGNAIKFTDKGGVDLRVLWEKQPSSSHITLVIEVQDTGMGIPQDKLEAIFKPFVQAGAHHEKEKQGTGLGLSIVKRLTEVMGGTVTVASILGEGSAFHLRFPNVSISARLPAGEKLSAAGEVNFNELRPATVLVVDDNETNCRLIAGMFADSHHQLIFGYSGEEAVEKAAELKPDIILLDIRMPGMGGRAALEEIRQIDGLGMVPVIAATASSLLADEASLKDRFSGYLRKPFSQRELFAELAQFLPPHAKPDDAGLEPADAPLPAVAGAPVPKELLTQLRRLLVEPWPSLRDSVAVNESKVFAQGLEGLGQRWQCQPLILYARKLLRDAENYSVIDLEKHLGEFSALIEQLAQNTRE